MTDEVAPVEGQVPAWSEWDRRNLRQRVARLDFVLPPTEVVPQPGMVAIASIARLPKRAKCPSCKLRRVVYAVEVNFQPSRARCWSCWTGGKPE